MEATPKSGRIKGPIDYASIGADKFKNNLSIFICGQLGYKELNYNSIYIIIKCNHNIIDIL